MAWETANSYWLEGAYLTQAFQAKASAGVDAVRILEEMDAAIRRLTAAACLRIARWHGDDLTAGPVAILRLGPLGWSAAQIDHARASRRLIGGLILGHPNGELWYAARADRVNLTLECGLDRYRPRLPRALFAISQAPLHRYLIRRAAKRCLARATGSQAR